MPRRKTDDDYRRSFADLDRRAAQLAARRDQLQARQQTDERKRTTRAKRVLGDALLRWHGGNAAPITVEQLIERYVTSQRDRDVAIWAIRRANTEGLLVHGVAVARLGTAPAQTMPAAAPNVGPLELAAWRRGQEQARIILGGAILRRLGRRCLISFTLGQLIAEDVVRETDINALVRVMGLPAYQD